MKAKRIGRAKKPTDCEIRVRLAVNEDGVRIREYSTRFLEVHRNQFGLPVLTCTDDELAREFLRKSLIPLVIERQS